MLEPKKPVLSPEELKDIADLAIRYPFELCLYVYRMQINAMSRDERTEALAKIQANLPSQPLSMGRHPEMN